MAVKFSTYRTDDIGANLDKMQVRPLDVMVTGATGAGKSFNIYISSSVVSGSTPSPTFATVF